METTRGGRWGEARVALVLCATLFATGLVGVLLGSRPAYAASFAPDWLPLVAAPVVATALVLSLSGRRGGTLPRVLAWSGLLVLLWTASGLPLDVLRVVSLIAPGVMPPGVDWLGLALRSLALAALVLLALIVFARPAGAAPARLATWYGFAALVLALPYPVLKTWWALGGSLGLRGTGADDLAGSFALWLPAVPWLLAAVLSLLLVLKPCWMPRRLMLVAGWSAAVVVAMIGPAACWSLITGVVSGDADFGDMAGWVFGLVYGSWFLWALAAGAATRSYQVRSAW